MKMINKIKIKGKNKKGKKILIISGVHGNELTSIYCTYLLTKCNYTDFNFKSITIISSINIDGVIKNTREIPNNSTEDLNRMFKSEDIINYKNELEKYIKKNNIIIDIHTSPKCDNFVLLNQDEYTNSYVDFCNKNDIHYLIRYSSANTIKKYCIDLNKITFTLELNKMDYIDYNSAENGKNVVMKIIKNCNSFNNKKSKPIHKTYIELQTYKEGLFIENKKCGDIVTTNDKIGKILNLKTFKKHKVKLTKKGKFRIICFGHTNYVDASNSICLLQPM